MATKTAPWRALSIFSLSRDRAPRTSAACVDEGLMQQVGVAHFSAGQVSADVLRRVYGRRSSSF